MKSPRNARRAAISRRGAQRAATSPATLAIDIGGTGIKASVLGQDGAMIADRVRLDTPHPASPENVLIAIVQLRAQLPGFDRISAGFPGVVRHGQVLTAPHLGTEQWHGFPLAAALQDRLGAPARVLNDADVQGFGVIAGRGLECVLTLGTGLGSALFIEGQLAPHLELSQHPLRKKKTYDEYLGDAALRANGTRKWNRRVERAIAVVRTLINFDVLYLGGGNAEHLSFKLPRDVKIVSNTAGITGGIHLWDPANDALFAGPPPVEEVTRAEGVVPNETRRRRSLR
jgi:polyphosphate glucokinase